MSDKPLVSILTPCYNGASYIDRFFETVIGQTHPNIELVFVDDGSTDDTLAKAESWRGRLEARGISFKLLTHPNGGQASAINVGLPEVSGKYVTWPDSDDIMNPRNIEMKVAYLEEHSEKGLAVCDVAHVYEDDLGAVVGHSIFDDSNPRLFDGLIRENNGLFCSGIAYMARAEALFSAMGGRRIYESPSGQNWQLLFPLTYHYDCGFIHQELATYVVRRSSHSRSYTTLEKQMRRTYELQDIIDHVLPAMGMSDEDYRVYSEYARLKYLPLRFNLAVRMGDKEAARRFKDGLDVAQGPSRKRNLLLLASGSGVARGCYALLGILKRALRNLRDMLRRRK